ncbi:MAG TPA: TfoX/Sxy family protein [Steroidobacteraceae bacterium]|nr:TfoX/Sxy family protein [Steroidobacteraceae bacterium]
MSVSDDYREFVLEQLAPAGRVTSRGMFGGVGLYLDSVFFALIADDSLYFKTDDTNRPRFQSAGSRPFCPYPDRPDLQMGYWEVPADVLEDADVLAVWAREALGVALRAKTAARPVPRRGKAAKARKPK